MPSGEIAESMINAYATVGQVGNVDHMNVASGKLAGHAGKDDARMSAAWS